MALICREPVPETHAQFLDAFYSANAGCQVRTKQTAVELTGFEMRPIAQDDYSVERQARFRTIPVNEFIDGVTITSLGVRTGEAVQDRGFCMLEIGQASAGSSS